MGAYSCRPVRLGVGKRFSRARDETYGENGMRKGERWGREECDRIAYVVLKREKKEINKEINT